MVHSRDRHYNYVKDMDTPIFGVARVGEYEMIEYPITDRDILKQGDAKDDSKLFRQTMVGLAKVTFPDYRRAYQGVELPNVKSSWSRWRPSRT
ncbi:hypothetical protein [Flavonifractor sp. HCP28S3_F3]|uniref:hypothetical protein n=1 Tax=Flavonifractor sp. HCP28S3_F3 TaxID=3438939 RepID=UPI003F8998AA